ncbi:hypothetical protein [Spiroplasma endosymbiont of Crioceris asparagi]|uniref:hypothetical protein n=1 Tax=Spiroplasma endosymbiont of Crioceris asparagi TaxID=3066286 RepID=UPI0030D3128A
MLKIGKKEKIIVIINVFLDCFVYLFKSLYKFMLKNKHLTTENKNANHGIVIAKTPYKKLLKIPLFIPFVNKTYKKHKNTITIWIKLTKQNKKILDLSITWLFTS